MKKLKWFKLDNVAKMYPIFSEKHTESIFRISAFLKDEVNPDILLTALKDIIPRFPSIGVKLRRGVFWYFFEENDIPPKVFLDDGITLKKIDKKKNKKYLFRVIYYKKRVSVEFFHAITDGLGGCEFLKCLIHRYLELNGAKDLGTNNLLYYKHLPTIQETEDSFSKHAKKTSIKELIKSSKSELNNKDKKGYRIKKPRFPLPGYTIIDCRVDTKQLLNISREKEITMTSYLASRYLYAIYETCKFDKSRFLSVFLPVNLRKMYSSKTLRNFVLYTRSGLMVNKDSKYTIEDFENAITKSLKEDVSYERFDSLIKTIGFTGLFFPFRILPLPIKYLSFKIGKFFSDRQRHTSILSNLGKINYPDNFNKYVENMSANVNLVKTTPISLGVLSFDDTTIMSFTSMLKDNDIIKAFTDLLVKDGLDLTVESNLRGDNHYVL